MTVILETPITTENITPLRKARERAGLTQVELAERVGVSQGYISLVESGWRCLSDDLAADVAEVLERARQDRLARREAIGQMLDEMPLSAEQMAMLHGGE